MMDGGVDRVDWVEVRLGEVVEPRGEKVSPAAHPSMAFLGMDHVEAHTMRIVGQGKAREMRSSCSRFYKEDVIYGRLRPYLNKVTVPGFDGLASAEFIVLPSNDALDAKFLAFRLNARDFASFASHLNEGDRPRVSFEQIGAFPLPLPPLLEQRAIVGKIEALFSELDKGVEQIETARRQLKHYRQSVLKAAFEGKLTAEWRAAQPDLPAAEGLPPGWRWARLDSLGALARGKSRHRPRDAAHLYGGPYPFVQTGEVKAARGVLREFSKTYSEAGLAQSRLWPKGTLCITIAANIAETAFLGFDGCFPDSIVGFTAAEDTVVAQYIQLFLESAKHRISAFAPATAQKNINLTTLENLVIPLPPLPEQRQIVSEIERRFSVLDELEGAVGRGLEQAAALRQSILQKAFAGRLLGAAELAALRADPAWEPAAKLLERIRGEREKANRQEAKSARRRRS